MDRNLSALAVVLLAGLGVTAAAPAAHAASTASTCVGVSIQGSTATILPSVTAFPGASGHTVLTITNNAWSDATMTASIKNVTATGDRQFANDLQLGIDGTGKSAAALASAPAALATKPISAGKTVDIDVSWSYPSSVTKVPAPGSAIGYAVEVVLTGDADNTAQVSCSEKPVTPTQTPMPTSTPSATATQEPTKAPMSNPLRVTSLPVVTDTNGDGITGEGDGITYTRTVSNSSTEEIKDLLVASRVVPGASGSVVTGNSATPAATSTPSAPTATATSSPSPTAASATATSASRHPLTALSASPTSGTSLSVACKDTQLPANGSTTCTTSPYTISAADVTAGGVTNITTVSARDIAGAEIVAPEATAQTVALTPTPAPMAVVDPVSAPRTGFTVIDAGLAAVASTPWLSALLGSTLIAVAGGLIWAHRRRIAMT